MRFERYMRVNKVDPARFARKIGVSKFAIYRWIHGERMPRLTNIKAIRRATRGKVDYKDWYQ